MGRRRAPPAAPRDGPARCGVPLARGRGLRDRAGAPPRDGGPDHADRRSAMGQRRSLLAVRRKAPARLRELRPRRRASLSPRPPLDDLGRAESRRQLPAARGAGHRRFGPHAGAAARPRRYARLLGAAYGALKSVSPRNLVIGGNKFTGGDISPTNWARYLLLPNGRQARMDMWGHNPFSRREPWAGSTCTTNDRSPGGPVVEGRAAHLGRPQEAGLFRVPARLSSTAGQRRAQERTGDAGAALVAPAEPPSASLSAAG
jgi:hypothetical protein